MNEAKKTGRTPKRELLPRPMTFFLSEAQHRGVLRALRRHDAEDRSRALCSALGVPHGG
jgi:hypothetical protein